MTPINLNEISQRLDCGFRAFVSKKTGNAIFLPNEEMVDFIDNDKNPWEDDQNEIDDNFDDYIEIESWSSNEMYEVMLRFAEMLSNKGIRAKLIDCLESKKPFRNFKNTIDNYGDVRDHWFAYKTKCVEDFIAEQLEEFNL